MAITEQEIIRDLWREVRKKPIKELARERNIKTYDLWNILNRDKIPDRLLEKLGYKRVLEITPL